MKPLIDSLARLRAVHILSLLVFAVALALAASVRAQSTRSASWPTTKWVVVEGNPDFTPIDERVELAEKHRRMLEDASIWYQSLGFPAPRQLTEDGNLDVASGEAYLGFLRDPPKPTSSSHDSDGEMLLTSNPGFLALDKPMWQLMEASAVHELYHGVQRGITRSLDDAANAPGLTRFPQCQKIGSTHIPTEIDWIWEGTAAMVQIRWLEQQSGERWGHPFKGSRRPTWVRQFDQSLHQGRLTPEHRQRRKEHEPASWSCDYGTWYFWYAVGDMIGRNDQEKVAYTQYLFDGPRSFGNSGIGAADLGLKRAAEEYDAIGPYRDGLYDLYPEFVAQYLTEDRFYGNLQKVELGTPDLYETRSLPGSGPLGPIEPLGSRAWRFRIQLPENESSIPYNVRFTLDAPEGGDLDALHLIVGDRLFRRDPDPTVPYSAVMRTDRATPSAGGAIEYLVRVANVGLVPGKTSDAPFSLRVEVDGFYGNQVPDALTSGEVDAISGELPPGFAVRGPGKWSCSGSKGSRAIFDLVTPEEGRDIDQAAPGMVHSMEGTADTLDKMIQKAESNNSLGRNTAQGLRDKVGEARATLEAARTASRPRLDAAADKARAKKTTTLAATFVGNNGGEMCQLLLKATLQGRDGRAQSVAREVDEDLYPKGEAPQFRVDILQKSFFEALRGRAPARSVLDSWQVCAMTDEEQQKARKKAARSGCPPVVCNAGRLTLDTAEQGRVAGTFEFEVKTYRTTSGRCSAPVGRDKVVGHFNVASTDKGKDDNGLAGGIGAVMRGAILGQPGAPIFNMDDE